MTALVPVTAIIPAYNEDKRIGQVLGVLSRVDALDEIIVVDDGSTDLTAEMVMQAKKRDPRIRLISHPRNLGKGHALFTGKKASQAPILLMLDADLISLAPVHVEDLLTPVLKGEVVMTMGIFRGGRWNTDIAHTLTPWMTGQRCFRAEIMKYVQPQAASGYGLETALTVAVHQHGLSSRYIPWFGVTHPPSEVHRGLIKGTANRMKMYAHVVRALVLTLGWKRAVRFVKAWKLTS